MEHFTKYVEKNVFGEWLGAASNMGDRNRTLNHKHLLKHTSWSSH